MTEREMQSALQAGFPALPDIVIPNNCLYGWEADLLVVRRSRLVVEVEIKVTVADFRHDAKKAHKHEVLRTGSYVSPRTWIEQSPDPILAEHRRPNYFYYALPDTISGKVDVPEYAGLIIVRKKMRPVSGIEPAYDYKVEISKTAPRLHREKLDDMDMWNLLRSYHFKYWNIRQKEKAA